MRASLASGRPVRIDVETAYSGAQCAGDYLAWYQLGAGAGTTASTVVARWTPHGWAGAGQPAADLAAQGRSSVDRSRRTSGTGAGARPTGAVPVPS